MARIRSVKPELRTSLVVASWPREVRYAWVLLWGYLDDYGRGVDDLRLLVADLFPLDRDVTERKLGSWLHLMADKPEDDDGRDPPLCRYEVRGRRYLHATNWGEHQKPAHPTPSRIPPCPIHEPDANDTRTDPEALGRNSRKPPERFTPSRTPAEQLGGAGSREQGAGETREAPTGAAARIVRAYATNCPTPPAATLQTRIETQARALLAEGHPPDRLETAAANAARVGWTDLAVQLQRDATRANPTPNGSTTDNRVRAALDLAERLDQPRPERRAIR